MENKEDSNEFAPCKDLGWEVTDQELEDNFLLVCNASYMAYEFALAAPHQNLLGRADEHLQRLQQQSISPFPLPQDEFTIAQAGLIFAAEGWIGKARKQLAYAISLDAGLEGEGAISKTDLEGFRERFEQAIAAFCGGGESFLFHSGVWDGPDKDKKKEQAASNETKTSEEVPSQDLDHNLRLAYEASFWTNVAAANADVYLQTIYDNNLDKAEKCLERLKDDSKNREPFPPRGYTLAQAKIRLDLEKFAKAAYYNFHHAFDKYSLEGDDGSNRKISLQRLYRKFNPKAGDEPQPNIKTFLGVNFFHSMNPTEILKENKDFWATPDGKIDKKQAWWLQ